MRNGVELDQRELRAPQKDCAFGGLIGLAGGHAPPLVSAQNSLSAKSRNCDSSENFIPAELVGTLMKLTWTGAIVGTASSAVERASVGDWKILTAQSRGNNFWNYSDGVLSSPDYERLPRWGNRPIRHRTSRPLIEVRSVLDAGTSGGALTTAEDRVLARIETRGLAKGLACVGTALLTDYIVDKVFFKNDRYGIASGLADIIAAPALGAIPAPWWLRPAGMIALHTAGRLTDSYFFGDPKQDKDIDPMTAPKQKSASASLRISLASCDSGFLAQCGRSTEQPFASAANGFEVKQ